MKKLLILDVDETLIHTTREWRPTPAQFHYESVGDVYLRPHWQEFVDIVRPYYELALWTAASADYLEAIKKHLFSDVDFAFTWSCQHCRRAQYADNSPLFIKSLKALEAWYLLKNVVVADDRAEALTDNPENLVLMPPFYGNHKDDVLLQLARYLQVLSVEPDIRCIDKTHWLFVV
jgi:RNA polymerase II subunit A small phosphatase-like protein